MDIIKKSAFLVVFVLASCSLMPINVSAQDDFYTTITNKNIIYIAEENNSFDYSWQFKRSEYRDGVDFSLKLDTNATDFSKITKYKYDTTKIKYLSFTHHGDLPTTALMKVSVSDKFKDGDELYLYYYDETADELKFIDNNLLVKNGFVEFEIQHCSDYILTASIVKTALDNPQSLTVIIITLIGLGVVLVAVTLFVNNKY